MGIDETIINEIINRILSVAQPDRIILFGSAAMGNMNRDSDIDLLILEASPENIRKERLKVRRALSGLDFPFDILVMKTERFEKTKGIIGGIAFPANKSGKVIYELSKRG